MPTGMSTLGLLAQIQSGLISSSSYKRVEIYDHDVSAV